MMAMVVAMSLMMIMPVSAAADGGMAVVVQVLALGGFTVFAAVAFEHRPLGLLPGGALVEQRKYARIEAEMRAEREGDLRVLLLQTGDLFLDALDQHAGEQINRHDGDLHHAQLHLALNGRFQAWPGDAGKGQVDQLVIVVLPYPACHLGQFAVAAGIRRTATEEDDAGA